MKTPEDIKKAVSLCISCEGCEDCPYYEDGSCCTMLMLDIVTYIEQLESRAAPVQHGY